LGTQSEGSTRAGRFSTVLSGAGRSSNGETPRLLHRFVPPPRPPPVRRGPARAPQAVRRSRWPESLPRWRQHTFGAVISWPRWQSSCSSSPARGISAPAGPKRREVYAFPGRTDNLNSGQGRSQEERRRPRGVVTPLLALLHHQVAVRAVTTPRRSDRVSDGRNRSRRTETE
jgi:hypothetical protein